MCIPWCHLRLLLGRDLDIPLLLTYACYLAGFMLRGPSCTIWVMLILWGPCTFPMPIMLRVIACVVKHWLWYGVQPIDGIPVAAFTGPTTLLGSVV